MSTTIPPINQNGLPKLLFAVFAIFSIFVIIIGSIIYQFRADNIKREKINTLTEIAELKIGQIKQWRNEEIMDAHDIMSDPFLIEKISRWINHPEDSAVRQKIIEWLTANRTSHNYSRIMVVDSACRPLLSVPDETTPLDTPTCAIIASSLRDRTVAFSDLHKHLQKHDSISLEMVIPFVSLGAKGIPAAVVFEINPYTNLYPLIQRWPLQSRTSETLLLRHEGDSVVFLNKLRHRENTALSLKFPLSRKNLPAVVAVNGKKVIMEGLDYRGVPVVAITLPIPDSPWYLVSKIDKDEMYGPLRSLFFKLLALSFLLIAIAGLGVGLVQRHLLSRSYRTLYRSEQEKSRLSESLVASEEQFRTIFEDGPIGMALSDHTFKFIRANIRFQSLFGYSTHELSTLSFKEITHSSFLGKDIAEVHRLQNNEIQIYKTEKQYVKKNGDVIWGALTLSTIRNPDGGFLYFIAMIEDITFRKNADAALAAEKERLLVTLRSIGDGVITTDKQGMVVLVNRVAEELTGWTQHEAAGKQLTDIFTIINEQTRAPCENPVDKVLQRGGIIGLANHTALISKDGTERIIADSGAPIRDKDSNIIGVVLVFRDITEKQKTDAILQNAQKLESIGVLAGGIAHDFNNLLGGMFGYIDLARESLDDKQPEQASKSLSKAFSVFDRAKALTRQLLTFSKGGAPVLKTQSIAQLLKDSVLFVLSGSKIIPEFNIATDLWLCDIDENQIAQVIDNITINAQQAMPLGGIIKVSATNIPALESPETLKRGDYVRISITDHGTGIAKEHLSRIFDPFFTTKHQGSGLGLATTYSIISRHNGLIEVESELGHGATFHIYLPTSNKDKEIIASITKQVHTGHGNVLIMDDEQFILEVASSMFKKMGYTVFSVPDGDQAIALVKNGLAENLRFAFALLDLTIPGGRGGKETVQSLKDIDPAITVIASSGYSDDPVMAEPNKFGFAGRLIKPYRRDELINILEQLDHEHQPL